jgi:predicted dehydrogenase
LRHGPVHEQIYELIGEGKLGKITTIESNEYYYGRKTYFRRWNRLRRFSGGLWLTKACHDFDFLTWLAVGKPKSVYAVSSLSHYKLITGAGPRCRDCAIKGCCPDYYDVFEPLDGWLEERRKVQLLLEKEGEPSPDICLYNSDKDTFDNGIAVIEYDNDVRATYTVSVIAARNTRQVRVVGTEGMVEGDDEQGLIQFTERHTGRIATYDLSKEVEGEHGGADPKIISDFISVCLNGGTPRSGLEDGRLAVKLSLAATESSDKGIVVKFS